MCQKVQEQGVIAALQVLITVNGGQLTYLSKAKHSDTEVLNTIGLQTESKSVAAAQLAWLLWSSKSLIHSIRQREWDVATAMQG